jgi:malonyl-CoA O-methyltransferase
VAADGSGIDRPWLRRAFDRAAPRYDQAAGLQRDVANRLLERLDFIRIAPSRVVDVGAGTGYCTRDLGRRYPRASVVGVDIAPAMLTEALRRGPRLFGRQRFLCADAQRLALARDAFDLVFSSLTLQWCEDLPGTLAELWRVAAPGGLLLFSSLGPDTLQELRASWAAVDDHTHVNRFLDMHVVGDALVAAGFRDVVMDVDRVRRVYPDALGLMRELKALGAHNVTTGRPRHLLGRARLDRLRLAYEAYRGADGLPATYEVVFGHAWKPEAPGRVAVEFRPRAPGRGAHR